MKKKQQFLLSAGMIGILLGQVATGPVLTVAAEETDQSVTTEAPLETTKVAPQPTVQLKEVYRLYHSGLKVHLYTTDKNERNVLQTRGWKYEGIAWYSQP